MKAGYEQQQETSNRFVRFFAYCINKIWLLLAFSIILLSLLHISLVFLLPKIDNYRSEIVDWVEKKYEIDIAVDRISAEWSVEGPVVTLSNFRVETPNQEFDRLKIGDVSLYFNILTSLWNQRISTQDIVINNADINFEINRTLGVDLDVESEVDSTEKNIKKDKNSSDIDLDQLSEEIISRLFDQRKFSLANSKITLHTLGGTEFKYHVDQLVVRKFGDRHQLSGELLNDSGAKLSLVMEIYGDPANQNSYSTVYAKGSDIAISQLPWLKHFPVAKPTSGKLSVEFWGTWKEKHWQRASINLSLFDANWASQDKEENGETKNKTGKNIRNNNQFSLMASWENNHSKQGYLALHHLRFKTPDIEQQIESDLVLKFTQLEKLAWSWDFIADKLELAPIANYFGFVMDKNTDLSHFLIEAKPALILERVHLNLNRKPVELNQSSDDEISKSFNLSFSNLEYLSWNDIPRANGLSGTVNLNNNSGKARFSAQDISLELGQLFRDPLEVTNLDAEILWEHSNGSMENIKIKRLSLINDDLSLQAKAHFFEQDSQPMMSLYTEILSLNVGKLSSYLPVGTMKPSLVKYLDEGIVSGEMKSIKSVVRGPTSGFPYPDDNGVFIALGELENTGYRYLSDWPMAKDMNARLLFAGNGMDITASGAHVSGNKVLKAHAVINDFSDINPLLKLTLDVKSKDNSATTLLQKTPISFISDALETIHLKGQFRTKIKLQVGMSDSVASPLKLTGGVTFDPKSSELSTSYLTATAIEGEIKFSENSVEKSSLKVDYRGKRLSVGLRGKKDAKDAAITLDVKGVMPASGIGDFIDKSWADKFSGESVFTTLVQFGPENKPETTQILVLSDLKGMAVDLPGEFSKAATDTSEMYLRLNLSKRSTGKVRWNGLSAQWYWDETLNGSSQNDFSRKKQIDSSDKLSNRTMIATDNQVTYGGDFYINVDANLDKLVVPGVRVSGELGDVDLMAWWNLIDEMMEVQSESDAKTGQSSYDSLLVESIDLKLSNLSMPSLTIDDVLLSLHKPLHQAWVVDLKSDQGNLFLQPNIEKPWLLKLENIKLNFIEEKAQDKNAEVEKITEATTLLVKPYKSKLRPSELENIDFSCKQCVVQDKDYGDTFVQIRKIENGVSYNGYSVKENQHELSLSGDWLEFPNASDKNSIKPDKTTMQFDLSSPEIGSLLKKWNFDVAIEDSSGKFVASIDWAGAPWQIDYTQLNGVAHAKLGKGVLSELSDGKGRLFSLLTLQSLARRLTLDFKDVFQKGFFFDSIEGTFVMKKGIISTENLQVKGNVADIKVYGTTDVKDEKIEQLAVVSPHLTSSFPLLAAWAIEPTTGVIVFLVGKIMEPVIEVVTRIEYRIHGSFDEPIVDQIVRSKKKINKEEFLSQQQRKEAEEKQLKEKLLEKNTDEKSVEDNKDTSVPID